MESIQPLGALAHDVIGWQHHALQGLFDPRSVALIGASEKPGSVGQALLSNLVGSASLRLYPVNPKHASLAGLPSFKALADVPETPDLVVIATPAPGVPALIQQAADKGVKNAIIISAGFKEGGPEGVALEAQIQGIIRRSGMRVLGPNCLGLMRPPSGLNATFAVPMARPGRVAFLSQSGALLSSILDWSLERQVGFSAFVSMGSMLDLGWGDFFDYLANDPQTKSILVYMESIGDARSFMSAAREVALTKPIIVLKAGRSAAGARAAASHTGSLTGADDVLDAAFKRCGVLRVNNIAELFNMAEALDKQPRPKGKRLAIITNAGGPGVLATDALLENDGELAVLTPAALKAMDPFLPLHWSHANPVDVLGDAGPERYAKSLKVVAQDPNVDGILVILTPQAMSDAAGTAQAIAAEAAFSTKPLLASWMGGLEAGKGEAVLKDAGIPCFAYPDTAARTFNHLWRYHQGLLALYETPQPLEDGSAEGRERAAQQLRAIRASGRTVLTETESKALLSAYGITGAESRVAATAQAAVTAADSIGYPVVLKLNSLTITHKTDVGGVQLNLGDAAAVQAAFARIQANVEAKQGPGHFDGVAVQPMLKMDGYELIVGASLDPQFGPVLLFGSGGQLVEVYKDRALGLPPLNSTLARLLMEGSRIYTALKGVRGRKPVDLERLEQVLVRLSQLIMDHPCIKELDINPLLASPSGILALDGRVILHDPAIPEADLPRPAIRAYPAQYRSAWESRDGRDAVLRPIRPEDEPMMADFHASMEGQPSYQQYLERLQLPQGGRHERLLRLCFNDFDRQITLVAESGERIVGVARLTRQPREDSAEFAVQIAADWQGQGLGQHLMERLLAVGAAEGLKRVQAGIYDGEDAMLALCQTLGFTVEQKGAGRMASLELKPPKASSSQQSQ